MSDLAAIADALPRGQSLLDRKMKKTHASVSGAMVAVALLGGLGYIGFHVAQDLGNIVVTSIWPYALLGLALLIALGFEFVNGFHDTANAVATVIYTPPWTQISPWSGRACGTLPGSWPPPAWWLSPSLPCSPWS